MRPVCGSVLVLKWNPLRRSLRHALGCYRHLHHAEASVHNADLLVARCLHRANDLVEGRLPIQQHERREVLHQERQRLRGAAERHGVVKYIDSPKDCVLRF